MKFVIYREIHGKRKTLVEWDKDEIIEALSNEIAKYHDYRVVENLPTYFENIISEFKKETIKIP